MQERGRDRKRRQRPQLEVAAAMADEKQRQQPIAEAPWRLWRRAVLRVVLANGGRGGRLN